MGTNFTDIASDASKVAATFNNPLDELDEAIEVLKTNVAVFSVPVALPDTAHGNHYGDELAGGQSTYIGSFVVPDLFSAIGNAWIILIPTTTGTIDWTCTVSAGAPGEDENANSDSATADDAAVTDDELEPIDVAGAFNGLTLAAGDIVGVKFTIDALADTTAVLVLGLVFEYSPSSEAPA